MNQVAHRIIMLGVIGILFYILIWPFINSFISGNYFIQAGAEGSKTMTYKVQVDKDLKLTASIENYNNIATQTEGDENLGPFSISIEQETYEKIKAIVNETRSFHLVSRHHIGYAFYYNSNDNASLFYSADEKAHWINLASILTDIARGSEKVEAKQNSITYGARGLEKLDELYKKLDL